jgi:NTE family protein
VKSNTPVGELISEHTRFWTKKHENELRAILDPEGRFTFDKWDDCSTVKRETDMPTLLLTVVKLYPEKEAEDQIPSLYDYNMTKDRVNDIRFHDKTEHDLKMALAVPDYHDFSIYARTSTGCDWRDNSTR